jgi:Trk K+ transport system NAD-binding subunit
MPLVELPLPEGAAVTLIVRKNLLVPPRPSTRLEPGDHSADVWKDPRKSETILRAP